MKDGTRGTQVKLKPWRCDNCKFGFCDDCIDVKRLTVGLPGFDRRICSCKHAVSVSST